MDNDNIFNDMECVSKRFIALLDSRQILLNYLDELGIEHEASQPIFTKCVSALGSWFAGKKAANSEPFTSNLKNNPSADFGIALAGNLRSRGIELKEAHALLKRLRWACLDFPGLEDIEESRKLSGIALLHRFWDVCEMAFCSEWLQLAESESSEELKSLEIIRIQRDLAVRLSGSQGLEETFRLGLDAALKISGLDAGGIYLMDEADESLRLAYSVNLPESFVSQKSHYERSSPQAKLVLAGKSVFADYGELKRRIGAEESDIGGIRAAAVVPLSHDGKVIGCLNAGSYRMDSISETGRLVLESIAGVLGAAVARDKTLKDLRQIQERLRLVLESSNVNVFHQDRNLVYQWTMNRLDSLDYNDPIGKTDFDYFTEQDAKHLSELKTSVLESGTPRRNEVRVELNGKRSVFDLVIEPWLDASGDTIGVTCAATDITEHRHAIDSNRFQATILQSISDAVIATDLDLKITSWNEQAEAIYGWTQEEVLGKNIDGVLKTEFLHKSQAEAQKELAEHGIWKGEVRQKKKDGSSLFVEAYVTLIRNSANDVIGGVTVNRNITKRKDAESQFQEMESRKRAMLDTTLQSIVLFSPDGEIVMLNKTAELWIKRVYGHDVKEGDSAFIFPHSEDARSFRVNFRKALKGKKAGGEWRTHDRSGKVYWFALDYLPIRERNIVSGVCFCAMDITERKRLEKELMERQIESEEQSQLLERKNIALSELIEHAKMDRELFERRISNNIEQIVLPIVSSLKLTKGDRRDEYADLLENSLRDLLSEKGSKLARPELGLTPREIQICEMIKQGLSSKEIVKLLGIGIRSIDSHRYNIRKKLGLLDRSSKLITYLKSL